LREISLAALPQQSGAFDDDSDTSPDDSSGDDSDEGSNGHKLDPARISLDEYDDYTFEELVHSWCIRTQHKKELPRSKPPRLVVTTLTK